MLKIIAERIPSKDGPLIEILEICALQKEELPAEYISTGLHCFKGFKNLILRGRNEDKSWYVNVYDPGMLLTIDEYIWLLDQVEKCGQRLYEINKKIRNANRGWNGIFVSSF